MLIVRCLAGDRICLRGKPVMYAFFVCLFVFAYGQVCFFRKFVVALVWCGVVFFILCYVMLCIVLCIVLFQGCVLFFVWLLYIIMCRCFVYCVSVVFVFIVS